MEETLLQIIGRLSALEKELNKSKVIESIGTSVREKLTANLTYYVRTDGSDSNTGLVNSSGGAFLTLQKAYDVIAANLDLAGFTVTVQVGDGTYTGGVTITKSWVGGGNVIYNGNSGTPTNVIISRTSGHCFAVFAPILGILQVNNMKLTTATSGQCIWLSASAFCTFTGVDFAASAGYHMVCDKPNSVIQASGNYTISGGALAHMFTNAIGSLISISSRTITLSGTPNFSQFFAFASSLSLIFVPGNTYSGSATGTRYLAQLNSIIQTNGGGATYLPGDVGGSVATGGQYV